MKDLEQIMRVSISLLMFFISCQAVGSIYLNGIDVTNARDQRLKNVDVYIDKEGSVYIEGKYDVKREDAYIPLTHKQAPKHQETMPHTQQGAATLPVEVELPKVPAELKLQEPPSAPNDAPPSTGKAGDTGLSSFSAPSPSDK